MRISELQRLSILGLAVLAGVGLAGFFGLRVVEVVKEQVAGPTHYEPGQTIPRRVDCINDNLKSVQGFNKQAAYDINVRCEQIIQSMEGHAADAAARRQEAGPSLRSAGSPRPE